MMPCAFNKIFNPDIKSLILGTCAKTLLATIKSGLIFFFFKSMANFLPKNFFITLKPLACATFAVLFVGSIPKDL